MVTPGLYEHYKGGRYRVLFLAQWDFYGSPLADQELIVAVGPIGTVPEEPARLVVIPVQSSAFARALQRVSFYEVVMRARWSTNTNDVLPGNAVVIYVSLYGEGRVSARTLVEFEEHVDAPCAIGGPSHRVARFKRIGE